MSLVAKCHGFMSENHGLSTPAPARVCCILELSTVMLAHITELKNLLGTSQFVSAIDVPLRNAGLTPLAGTFESAKKYFQGTLLAARMPAAVQPSSPIQYHCQQNYVVLVTDGLPSVKADGTVGSTADLIAQN